MSEFEIKRRLVHSSGVILPILYVTGFVNEYELSVLLLIGVFMVLILEYFRLYKGFNHTIYDKLTREYESENIAGYALYIIGMFIAWILFSPIAAISGMLMLSIGDPVSGLLGNIKRDVKSMKWVPMIGMFVICCLIVAPFTIYELGFYTGIFSALLGSVGAVIVDEYKPTINGRIIDDNLTIPIFSALLITVIMYLF